MNARIVCMATALTSCTMTGALGQTPDLEIAGSAGSGTNQIRLDLNPASSGTYEVARRVAPGTFQIALRIHNLSAWVWAVHADLAYDPAAISYVSIAPGPAFGDAWIVVTGPGSFEIRADRDPCVGVPPGTQTVATVTFASVTPHNRQSGFDITAADFFFRPAPCQMDPATPMTNFSLAKGVVVVGDSTISCLNVNTTGDAASINLAARNPDSNSAVGIGEISLRSALQIANAVTGGNRPTFRIPGASPTIMVGSALPALSDTSGPTYLDGGTQPSGMVQVSGAGAGGPTFNLTSGSNTIKKLGMIGNPSGPGVRVTGSSNTLIGNWIGLNAAGVASANAGGVDVAGGSANLIGGVAAADSNLISGNTSNGLTISGGASGTLVRGNRIGLNAAGVARANAADGVSVVTTAGTGNVIGGSAPGSGNLISGNGLNGVQLTGSNVVVQGNFIGTDPTGVLARANAQNGLFINYAGNTLVGGPTAAHGNVISGNTVNGVRIGGLGATGNTLHSNVIGLNAAANALLGNGANGVSLESAPLNLVGGSGVGNVISGNVGAGVRVLDASNNTVNGNTIGLNAARTAARPNGNGVEIASTLPGVAEQNVIGGLFADEGNVIAGNAGHGIDLSGPGARDNVLSHNFIGLAPSGAGLGNLVAGVQISIGASSNLVTDNTIGSNMAEGVRIAVTGTDGNQVMSNTIGSSNNPNGADGVLVDLGPARTGLAQNTIRANGGNGVRIGGIPAQPTEGTVVFDNLIELNSLAGVRLEEDASASLIDSNLIAGNLGHGVAVAGAPANTISANTIEENGGAGVQVASVAITISENSMTGNGLLGIDLLADANGGQSAPVLTAASGGVEGALISGSLTSAPATSYTIEFFGNEVCDPSGFGEGRDFLGWIALTTSPSGTAAFTAALVQALAGAAYVTATATDPLGNTSEFSACMPVGDEPAPCPADLDGDGMVGTTDLVALVLSWGLCDEICPADLDGDGMVGSSDLSALVLSWGPCDA